jgi:hypothetical protein
MHIINIENISESFVRLNCEIGILKEIASRFTFRAEGFMFNPRYKAGIWDGYIRPINQKTGFCPKGLIPKVIQYIVDNGYKFTLDDSFKRFKETIEVPDLNLPFVPHAHQADAVELFVKKKRQVILSATGSGKSLIIYMITRILMDKVYDDQKILIIVPSISLVTQLYGDFVDYSKISQWDTEYNVHSIMGGIKKDADKKIYISTWQSLQHIKDKEYFEKFGAVIVDECFHGDTPILTKDGYKPIKNIEAGEIIINYDENKKIFKEDIVVKRHENLNKSQNSIMLEIELDNGDIIKVTENHKFLTTNRGWVAAKNLTIEDDICSPNTIIDGLYATGNIQKTYWFNGVKLNVSHNKLIRGIISNTNTTNEITSINIKILHNLIKNLDITDLISFRSHLLRSHYGKLGNIKRDEMIESGELILKKQVAWNKGLTMDKAVWNKGLTKDTNQSLMRVSIDRMGEKNPVHKIKDIDTWHKNVSIGIKKAILDGRCTPKSNNRMTHADIKYKNKIYRSSWECAWQYINPSHLYEKIRIPYVDIDGTQRTTIIDFYDTTNKVLIEIKPKSVANRPNSICKISACFDYCKNNNLTFNLITEDEIFPLINTILCFDDFNEKATRLLKGYQK